MDRNLVQIISLELKMEVGIFTVICSVSGIVLDWHAESLWLSSAISVFLAIVFVGICSVMAISALARGETRHIQLLPQLNNGVSFFNLFTAVPVIVTAFTFHFNGKTINISKSDYKMLGSGFAPVCPSPFDSILQTIDL